ncbi:hypothetical protein NMG60_11012557 [Bertholletia excelsa]
MGNWKKLWQDWDLQGILLLGFSLQALLLLLAPLRSRTSNSVLLSVLWFFNILSSALPNFAMGLAFRSRSKNDSSGSYSYSDLLSLWVSFILLQLGGSDTLTGFSPEDNDQWTRVLFQFYVQFSISYYILYLAVPKNELWVLARQIKIGEWIRALYRGSSFKLMANRERRGHTQQRQKPLSEERLPPGVPSGADFTGPEVAAHAFGLFKCFKGFFANQATGLSLLRRSRGFFLNRKAKDAFKVIEVELNLFYATLYTKYASLQGFVAYFFRVLGFCIAVIVLLIFSLMDKKKHRETDIKITYILLYGVLALDAVSFFMLFLSDFSAGIFLRKLFFLDRLKRAEDYTDTLFFCRRWSGSLSRYSLLYYCLHPWSKKAERLIAILRLTDILNGIAYVKTERLEKHLEKGLKELTFNDLRHKSQMAEDPKVTKKISSAKGEWVLEQGGYTTLLPYTHNAGYDKSLVLWHVATEL